MDRTDTFTQRDRVRWYFYILVVLVGIMSVLFAFSQYRSNSSNEPSEEYTIVDIPQDPEDRIPALPTRLVIPAISVDAEVQYVGLAPDGSGDMDVPSNVTDVAWYQDGIRPGLPGSAVIAGHYNGKDVPEAVFYELQTLQIGDEVFILSSEGMEDTFKVVQVETYAHDDPTTDVFISTDGKRRLNLITCGGEWLPEEKMYDTRTVVFTESLTDAE